MKKAWKWILGIVLVLVVLAALIIVPLVFHNAVGYDLRSYDRDFRMPMMDRHYTPFLGGFMMLGMGLRWFIPLVLLGLVIYGVYRLGKRNASPAFQSAAPVAPVAPAPVQTCPKCGQVVQDGWNNCANCGKKL